MVLEDQAIREYHALIDYEAGDGNRGFVLYAVDSNPVLVNGASIHAPTRLHSGDRIGLGTTELVFFQAELTGGRIAHEDRR